MKQCNLNWKRTRTTYYTPQIISYTSWTQNGTQHRWTLLHLRCKHNNFIFRYQHNSNWHSAKQSSDHWHCLLGTRCSSAPGKTTNTAHNSNISTQQNRQQTTIVRNLYLFACLHWQHINGNPMGQLFLQWSKTHSEHQPIKLAFVNTKGCFMFVLNYM